MPKPRRSLNAWKGTCNFLRLVTNNRTQFPGNWKLFRISDAVEILYEPVFKNTRTLVACSYGMPLARYEQESNDDLSSQKLSRGENNVKGDHKNCKCARFGYLSGRFLFEFCAGRTGITRRPSHGHKWRCNFQRHA